MEPSYLLKMIGIKNFQMSLIMGTKMKRLLITVTPLHWLQLPCLMIYSEMILLIWPKFLQKRVKKKEWKEYGEMTRKHRMFGNLFKNQKDQDTIEKIITKNIIITSSQRRMKIWLRMVCLMHQLIWTGKMIMTSTVMVLISICLTWQNQKPKMSLDSGLQFSWSCVSDGMPLFTYGCKPSIFLSSTEFWFHRRNLKRNSWVQMLLLSQVTKLLFRQLLSSNSKFNQTMSNTNQSLNISNKLQLQDMSNRMLETALTEFSSK